jgi:Cu+-exporting ATPase
MRMHTTITAAPTYRASPTNGLNDPVCGMSVTEHSEHQFTHEGRSYYFCSAKCHGKFAANLGQYLMPGAAG